MICLESELFYLNQSHNIYSKINEHAVPGRASNTRDFGIQKTHFGILGNLDNSIENNRDILHKVCKIH